MRNLFPLEVVMKNSILKFCDVYERGADTNALLESLDDTINKIVRSCFKRFCGSVDADDIAQEVRIHLWEDIFEHPEKNYLENMGAVEAYKYLTTTIKSWVWRAIERSKNENVPTAYEEDGISVSLFVTLSMFDIEYTNFNSHESIRDYIQLLRDNCSDIPRGQIVLEYLAPKEDIDDSAPSFKYAGLSSSTFYKTIKLLKERAKRLLNDEPFLLHKRGKGNVKLTETQILEIRESPLRLEKLSKMYKVTVSTISNIRNKKSWKNI